MSTQISFKKQGKLLECVVHLNTGVIKGTCTVVVRNSAGVILEKPIDRMDINKINGKKSPIKTSNSVLADGIIELWASFVFVDKIVKKCSLGMEVLQDGNSIFSMSKERKYATANEMQHVVIPCLLEE
jgi:hypothetical protein